MYKNPRPCRIVPLNERSNQIPDRTNRVPCNAKKVLDRSQESRFQSFRARSQVFPSPISQVLRRAHKHLDEVVMQAVVELTLKSPLELRMVEIPGMHFKEICVHRPVSYTHLRAHETPEHLVCRLL